jgi:hypothetical protein
MKIVSVDASQCKDSIELFEMLKKTIGSPEWHGLSTDAFLDTMIWHDVNMLKPPYTIIVLHSNAAPREVRDDALLMKRCIYDDKREYIRRHRTDRQIDFVVE